MNNDDKVRNAVVRIKYHNYTCTHLIFVRQGYKPQEIVPSTDCMDFTTKNGNTGEFHGGAKPVKWSTFNMISKDIEATDPRDEGSLFKWGNSDDAIDAACNIHMKDGAPLYHNLSAGEFNEPGDLLMVDNATGDIMNDAKEWSEFEKGDGFTGEMSNAATIRDFEQLYCSNNTHFGYGVLYADGATETQSTIDMAYGYYRRDSSPNAKAKGMRGLFVYYWDKKLTGGSSYNARNIFFPIGRAGYGHRKNGKDDKLLGGILRYSCSREGPDVNTFTLIAPVFASIYRRPGAIYWSGDTQGPNQFLGWDRKPTAGTAYGLDINYFSFDVNSITNSNINEGKDACFVRTVER